MKLYYLPGSCALADHIVLEWIGKPFEAINVPRDQLKNEYLKINPGGNVPTLDDDGWILTENVAILGYLADSNRQADLLGDGGLRGRAEVMRWLGFLNSDVHKAFLPLFGPAGFVADPGTHQELGDNARAKLRGFFVRLDQRLAAHPYLGGQKRSIADPYLFVVLRWAKNSKVDLSGLDHLERFSERMLADAGVQRAMKAQGLT